MPKHGKKFREAQAKVPPGVQFKPDEAVQMVKDLASAKFDETGAWIISQHGTRSGWGANITADPRVRLRVGDRWRSGIAEFVHGDDVAIRARSFANNAVLGRLVGATFAALATTPVSVRVTFD